MTHASTIEKIEKIEEIEENEPDRSYSADYIKLIT